MFEPIDVYQDPHYRPRFRRYKNESITHDMLFDKEQACGFVDVLRTVLPPIPREHFKKAAAVPETSLRQIEIMNKVIKAHLKNALARAWKRYAEIKAEMDAAL